MEYQAVLLFLVAAGPGAVALILLLARRGQRRVERDEQLEELRELSRELVAAEMEALREQMAELEKGRRRERAELRALREEVEGLRKGVAALLAQVRAAGMAPAWEPEPGGIRNYELGIRNSEKEGGRGAGANGAREEGGGGGVDTVALQRRLVRHFSLGEMENLVFQLGVDGELVWSEVVTREGRARALVLWADRHGRLEELVGVCRGLRKSVRW